MARIDLVNVCKTLDQREGVRAQVGGSALADPVPAELRAKLDQLKQGIAPGAAKTTTS